LKVDSEGSEVLPTAGSI
ncbi:hypothetical protein CP8484711_0594, partial [Chlamydia psittaci 84-8471/1]